MSPVHMIRRILWIPREIHTIQKMMCNKLITSFVVQFHRYSYRLYRSVSNRMFTSVFSSFDLVKVVRICNHLHASLAKAGLMMFCEDEMSP